MTEFHRTNINLFADDVAYLTRRYGTGWTERVREMVRQRVRKLKSNDLEADSEDLRQSIISEFGEYPDETD